MRAATLSMLIGSLVLGSASAVAQVNTHYHNAINGNFVLIGNTLAQDAAAGVPVPIVGSVGSAGLNTSDSGPDVFWRSNFPGLGQAVANTSITPSQARTQASLTLPPGSSIVHAQLTWSSKATLTGTPSATIARTGVFSQSVMAQQTWVSVPTNAYQGTADITALVQTHGAGAYEVGGIDTIPLLDQQDAGIYVGWSMVVVYQLVTDPVREIFVVTPSVPSVVSNGVPFAHTFTFNGSMINSGGTARLGVVAYEGDQGAVGDGMVVNAAVMGNAINPVNDVFNSTRSFFGTSTTSAGDLPQLTGTAGSMSGIDLDVFDITPQCPPGGNTVSVQFNTTADGYAVGVVAVALTTNPPCVTPMVTQQPSNQTLCRGENAQFTVAVNQAALSYQWRLNTVNLTTQRGLSGVNTATLAIEGVVQNDSGNYDCVVTTACGSVTSNAASLLVEACCAADINQSGDLTVQDIFDFLEAYFTGCP